MAIRSRRAPSVYAMTRFGLPVSTIQAIVAGIICFVGLFFGQNVFDQRVC